MAKTVLIVDDHAHFRALARALLQLEGFEVVGEAADALSALDAVRRLRPNVVVLDIQLPDLDGFEVAHRLARAGDSPARLINSRCNLHGGVLVTMVPRGDPGKSTPMATVTHRADLLAGVLLAA